MTREDVCERFSGRILRLAQRTFECVGPELGVYAEDLVGYGVIGLLEAFDRYTEEHGVDFSTFADYRIRGAMMDALRSADTSTRRRRQLARRLKEATERAVSEGAVEPGPEQIAAVLGTDLEGYWAMLDMVLPIRMVELDEAKNVAEEPEAPRHMLAVEARAALREAILQLPDREKQVILLYYGRDLSLAEIGAVFHVTPSRICQVLSSARARLRHALGESIDLEALASEGGAV